MGATRSPLHQRLAAELACRTAAGTQRQLGRQPAGLVDFSSNDYLGLSRHPAVLEALRAVPAGGSTGSRLLTGNSTATEMLEARLAHFHRAEAALLFTSGYTANLGFFSAVPSRHDTILYDAASHASVKEGIRASAARAWSFRHNDLADLERKLARATGSVFVAVEALYSMDGDLAPLPELAALCRQHGLHLVVDEAHTTGMFGPAGEGLVAALGLECDVFARLFTFGKALGGQGAAIAGPAVLRNYLLHFSRPFIYTTALPPAVVASLAAAYDLLPTLGPARTQLAERSTQLKAGLATTGSGYVPAGSYIIHPLYLPHTPGPEPVRCLAARLQAAGFDARAIVAPTVPAGTERLRLIMHAFNTPAEVAGLLAVLTPA